jgi:hypothetical protein
MNAIATLGSTFDSNDVDLMRSSPVAQQPVRDESWRASERCLAGEPERPFRCHPLQVRSVNLAGDDLSDIASNSCCLAADEASFLRFEYD